MNMYPLDADIDDDEGAFFRDWYTAQVIPTKGDLFMVTTLGAVHEVDYMLLQYHRTTEPKVSRIMLGIFDDEDGTLDPMPPRYLVGTYRDASEAETAARAVRAEVEARRVG